MILLIIRSHVDIECDTQARNNPIFQGLPDTNLLVDCPPVRHRIQMGQFVTYDCHSQGCEEDATLPVFGSGATYHEASSICRAAIHVG